MIDILDLVWLATMLATAAWILVFYLLYLVVRKLTVTRKKRFNIFDPVKKADDETT